MISIVFIFVVFLFFFKQKTAYEMRISDWSSDVCSSDLVAGQLTQRHRCARVQGRFRRQAQIFQHKVHAEAARVVLGRRRMIHDARPRSEEHTSELQSLMRISYAVFCLKKKKTDYERQPYKYSPNTNVCTITPSGRDLHTT